MSGVSVLMLVLLVHIGGVELDSAHEAAIDRFAAGTPVGRLELTESGDGHYQFAGGEEVVRVERLAHPDLGYAIVYGPSATEVLGVGAVSLLALGEALRVREMRDSLTLPAADALVAWRLSPIVTGDEATNGTREGRDDTQMGATTEDAAEDDAQPDAVVSDVAGSLIVTAARGQMSISHPESGQVMVLRYSR